MKTTIFEKAKQLKGRYFFGTRKNETSNIYLTVPKWDCGWYWGFGYLGNSQEHYHLDGYAAGRNINMFDALQKDYELNKVLDEKNLWLFCELMATAYALKETAEILGRGGSHYTANPCSEIIKNEQEVKRINEEVLPSIFLQIDKIFKTKETREETEMGILKSMGVKFTAKFLKHDYHFAGDKEKRDIYLCKFSRKGKSFSIRFGQSIANKGIEPTADEVFECLQKNEVGTLENFCREFGYDINEESTEKIYNSVCEEYEKVNGFFTEEEIGLLQNV